MYKEKKTFFTFSFFLQFFTNNNGNSILITLKDFSPISPPNCLSHEILLHRELDLENHDSVNFCVELFFFLAQERIIFSPF